jgi:hypothetical protein
MPSAAPPLDDATTACLLSWIRGVSSDAGVTPASDAGAPLDASTPRDGASDDAGKTVVRVACGSTTSITDHNNNVWAADMGSSAGQTAVPNPPVSVANTMDGPLYNGERYGDDGKGNAISFTYDFTVPNGSYSVTLKFAETYWTAAGKRIFGVSINGEAKLSNFDIFSVAGGKNIAHDETFQVDVTGGRMTIQFNPGTANDAKIDAIEILSK